MQFRIYSPFKMGGFMFRGLRIGSYDRIRDAHEFFLIRKGGISLLFVLFGIYHLFLFAGRRKETSYLYFAVVAVLVGLATAGMAGVPYQLMDSYWFNHHFMHVSMIMLPTFLILFFHSHFEYPERRILTVATSALAGLYLSAYALGPFWNYAGMFYHKYVLKLVMLTAFLAAGYCIFVNARAITERRFGAKTIGFGIASFTFFGAFDFFATFIGSASLPALIDVGFIFFVISMAMAQAYKLNRIHRETEHLNARLKELNESYYRFVPQEFLRILGRDDITSVQLGDNIASEMAVLFSDIRSFTQISESLSPEENFRFINAYLKRMSPIINKHNGFIDKYIGDAVMALFNHSAGDAVRSAIEMQLKIQEYNVRRRKEGYDSIRVGIGIHTGSLMLGTIGGEKRMDGTVISDAVNLAARMEGLTKRYKVDILISGACVQGLSENIHIRRLGKVQVKGKQQPTNVFEVLDAYAPEIVGQRKASLLDFEAALGLYESSDFAGAATILASINAASPYDKPAQLYAERCASYLAHGAPEGFEGVEVMDTK